MTPAHKKTSTPTPRPPVVAIVGHIDHGKSTLLDYIRHANVVAQEHGGITQHLSAYEAVHNGKTITFLDTPGHEAFAAMRSRGLSAADIAILVVSSEEGAKPQTLEAVRLIKEANVSYIVAFTKIDKPEANIERAKSSLLEHEIYLEGLGGEIPYVGVSGKTGEGIPELLDLILLSAELAGLHADLQKPAEGIVIEAHIESKRGASATLIIKDGTLKSGQFVVAGPAMAPVRIMENFLGTATKEASAGSPVRIVGFSALPEVGGLFYTLESKKEAEERARRAEAEKRLRTLAGSKPAPSPVLEEGEEQAPEIHILPLVIKSDVLGTGDAVLHEIRKIILPPRLELRVVSQSVGSVSEADVKLAGSGEIPGIVVGFNIKVDASAESLAERLGVTISIFQIIYQLAQWLQEEIEKRRPKTRIEEKTGTARILKLFSQTKNKIVLGGRVEEGVLRLHEEVKIMRRDLELGVGSIESLQAQKKVVNSVDAGNEFGAVIKTNVEIAPNDRLEAFEIAFK